MARSNNRDKWVFRLVLTAILSALIVAMTVVPYTGYISYGGILEITTLHIVVIIGAVFLGWDYGALLGAVWGITCIVRAAVLGAGNPAYEAFLNPLVSLLPRMAVGAVAGLVTAALLKTRLKPILAVGLAAAAGTLTNTVLVLSMYYLYTSLMTGMSSVFEAFKAIVMTIASLNGGIEIAAAVVIAPAVYAALVRAFGKKI